VYSADGARHGYDLILGIAYDWKDDWKSYEGRGLKFSGSLKDNEYSDHDIVKGVIKSVGTKEEAVARIEKFEADKKRQEAKERQKKQGPLADLAPGDIFGESDVGEKYWSTACYYTDFLQTVMRRNVKISKTDGLGVIGLSTLMLPSMDQEVIRLNGFKAEISRCSVKISYSGSISGTSISRTRTCSIKKLMKLDGGDVRLYFSVDWAECR
jgi:hypothetical protein